MKVLHVYCNDVPQIAMYVGQLVNAMPEGVECRVADNAVDMWKLCREFSPDIVHQHGMPLDSNSPKARVVISVHGAAVDTDSAYAVIARSPYELARQTNPRKELVRNPLITTTISFSEAAKTISAVYQRVMDSAPLLLMNSATRLSLACCLKAAIFGDSRWVEGEKLRAALGGTDFRRLYIYAEQEGVLNLVCRGMDILGIEAPEKQPTDNYLPEGYRVPQPMTGAAIVQMLEDIAANGVSLLRLTELTNMLFDDRLDEDVLYKELEAEKLKSLFQSVLQILSEQTLLTEGFMPGIPLDNLTTKRLRQQLVTRQQIVNP